MSSSRSGLGGRALPIEFETVQLVKPEWEQLKIADAWGLQISENVVPVVIPSRGRRTRAAAGWATLNGG
jgi:hypothetical protein